MLFDTLSGQEPTKTNTYNFYGLNRTRRAQKGEFEEMENMSTDEYPCASPSIKRRPDSGIITQQNIKAAAPPDISNVSALEKFTGIANGSFYYNGVIKSGKFGTLPDSFEWQIERLGQVYVINGYNKENKTSMMYTYNVYTDKFDYFFATMDSLIVTAVKSSKGNYLETFHYAYDTVADYKVTLKDGTVLENIDFFDKYATSAGTLPKDNIFEKVFSVGDELTIENFPTDAENVGQTWKYSASEEKITQYKNDYSSNNTVDSDNILNERNIDKHAIVRAIVTGFDVTNGPTVAGTTSLHHKIYFKLYNKNGEEIDFYNMDGVYCTGVKLSKRKRVFTEICSHNQRIFGTQPNGVNIYGSKSDEIYNFTDNAVVAGEAARLSDLKPGEFTGICEYSSSLLVFKESSIIIINGDNPTNYYTDIIDGIGCIDPKSIAVTPNGVIFLSYNGIYLFAGNTPQFISTKLNSKYISGTAFYDGNRYIINARRKDNSEFEYLVYDMRYGTWHKQTSSDIKGMFMFKGELWEYTDSELYCVKDENGFNQDWSMTSARIYDYTLNRKAPEEIWIKAELDEGAHFTVETSTDDNDFVKHIEYSKPGLFVVRCPCRIVMGNYYRYRISGSGRVIFYEIEIHRSESGREQNTQRQQYGAKINETKPIIYGGNDIPQYTY
jgi:hypothetical protein